MDIKLLKSKINLLKAQMQQLSESGYFTADEIDRHSKSLQKSLTELEKQLENLIGHGNAVNMNVVGSETVS